MFPYSEQEASWVFVEVLSSSHILVGAKIPSSVLKCINIRSEMHNIRRQGSQPKGKTEVKASMTI